MDIAVVLVIVGVIGAIASFSLKSLFVNTADKENPYRRLSSAIGYIGLIIMIWGMVLLYTIDV